MKGLEMTMVNAVILIAVAGLILIIVVKLVPTLGSWMSLSFKGIADAWCKGTSFLGC